MITLHTNDMKNITTKWWIIAVVVLIAGLFGWSTLLQSGNPDVIAQKGIHWHPRLKIIVMGEEVPIPADIGIGPQYAGMPTFGSMGMTAIHTHDDMPVIHLEFPGLVREEDVTLGNLFRIWGKDMRSFGSNMRMTVNGKENTEYENYLMHDGDKIELHYE